MSMLPDPPPSIPIDPHNPTPPLNPRDLPINSGESGGTVFELIDLSNTIFTVLFFAGIVFSIYKMYRRYDKKQKDHVQTQVSYFEANEPEELLKARHKTTRVEGWYQTGSSQERFWNGKEWTEEYRDFVPEKESYSNLGQSRLTEEDIEEFSKENLNQEDQS